jgi:hypothetical protein
MDIFETSNNPTDHIKAEGQTGWDVARVEVNHGIYMYIEGLPYPHKGLPTPEAIWAINVVKKTIIEAVKLLTRPQFWPSGVMVAIFPKSIINQSIASFNRITSGTVLPYFLKDELLTATARETKRAIREVLVGIGISDEEALLTAKCLAHILEYDSAYRFRFQDLCTETTSEKLSRQPIRELFRLVGVYRSREHYPNTKSHTTKLACLGCLLLVHPFTRRLIKQVIANVDLEKLQFDLNDRYWVCQKTDYDYFGKTYDERQRLFTTN